MPVFLQGEKVRRQVAISATYTTPYLGTYRDPIRSNSHGRRRPPLSLPIPVVREIIRDTSPTRSAGPASASAERWKFWSVDGELDGEHCESECRHDGKDHDFEPRLDTQPPHGKECHDNQGGDECHRNRPECRLDVDHA